MTDGNERNIRMKLPNTIRGAVLAFGVVCATGANAQTAASGGDDATKTSQSDAKPDAMKCKRFATTGTRVKKKVCRTEREWEQIAEAARKAGSDMQAAGGVNSARPPE